MKFNPKNIKVNEKKGVWGLAGTPLEIKTTGKETNAFATNGFERISGKSVSAFSQVKGGDTPVTLVNFKDGTTIGFHEKRKKVVNFFQALEVTH